MRSVADSVETSAKRKHGFFERPFVIFGGRVDDRAGSSSTKRAMALSNAKRMHPAICLCIRGSAVCGVFFGCSCGLEVSVDILIGLRFSSVAGARPTTTANRRFHALNVTRGTETQMVGSLATFALIAEQFPLVPLLSAVVV